MNYEQKYKEALERCKKEFNFNNLAYSHEEIKQKLEHIFPELKESEDEKIRKYLIDVVNDYCKGSEHDGCIAWLEKQGEQKYNYCEYFDGYDLCLHKKNFGSVTDESKENCKNNKFFIEKQGEQSNKVEPKFKVGDWVVYSFTDQIYQVNQIVEAKQLDDETCGYTLEDGSYFSGSLENSYRLWTIQDANDGDVLAAHECLVLFKEIDGLNIKCYCTYHFLNHKKFFVDTLQNKTAFTPATKEQRALLFSKMKEAGFKICEN